MSGWLQALPWPALAIAHAVVTLYLCGLIWTIQVVHYPLFLAVGEAQFAAYERAHCRRIGAIVMVPMLVEAALAGLVWLRAPAAHAATAAIGAVLLAVVWGSTFLLQVPCHHRLEQGYDAAAIRRLVATNWLRTLAWTGRGACASALLWPLAA
ncbi:MAG: hypothetical protein ACK58X_10380 [Planctomycetota bacterium]